MPNPSFTAEEAAAVARLLKAEIGQHALAVVAHDRVLKSALAKLQPETVAAREPFPALVQGERSLYLRRKKWPAR
jgi:regulator of extracellular matrix RemA (YlzA/DUF370 family)